MRLAHNNDRKGKSQSHTVCILEEDCSWKYLNLFALAGYGSDKQEALEEFKAKFKDVIKDLKKFEDQIDSLQDMVEIDYAGHPIGEEN